MPHGVYRNSAVVVSAAQGRPDCEPPAMSKGFISLGLGSVREPLFYTFIRINRRGGLFEQPAASDYGAACDAWMAQIPSAPPVTQGVAALSCVRK